MAMKRFNTTGTCFPGKHYMVDLSDRIAAIRAMVDNGDYFCINRGRQYGKTTTLEALDHALQQDCVVFSISFEGLVAGFHEFAVATSRIQIGQANDGDVGGHHW